MSLHVDSTQFSSKPPSAHHLYSDNPNPNRTCTYVLGTYSHAPPDSAAFSCVKCKTRTSVSNSVATAWEKVHRFRRT